MYEHIPSLAAQKSFSISEAAIHLLSQAVQLGGQATSQAIAENVNG
jgi:hypothetical protein